MAEKKLLGIDPSEFDEIITTFVSKLGFEIESKIQNPRGEMTITAKTTNPVGGSVLSLIQAGPYSDNVEREDIEQLYKEMKDRNAIRAAFITTSNFTEDAIEYARERPISLINRYQIVESLESHGTKTDKEFIELLQKHGLGEKRLGGEEQYFVPGKTEEEARRYFESKKGTKKMGIIGREETITKLELKYAPVSVFRVRKAQTVPEEETMSKKEVDKYLYVNLTNAETYYIQKVRKGTSTKDVLKSTSILRDIIELPPESKSHLLNLLDHGDLPYKKLDDKYLSILEKKGVVKTSGTHSMSGEGHASKLLYMSYELLDLLTVIIDEILLSVSQGLTPSGEIGGGSEGGKSVMARVDLPHIRGGDYDLSKHLTIEKGLVGSYKQDPIVHTSKEIGGLLESVFGAIVQEKGIIFMPLYRCRYADKKTKITVRRESLLVPKFISEEKIEKERKITHVKKDRYGIEPYRIIR